VAPCRYCVNRRFEGTYRLSLQGYVPPKRRLTQYLHGNTSQKTAFLKKYHFCVCYIYKYKPIVSRSRKKITPGDKSSEECWYLTVLLPSCFGTARGPAPQFDKPYTISESKT
jgi:hypothetical protein